eukprot:NODE_2952_length_1057_cov_46.006452_g2818_i0.p1 GENE.NODE_2952_length_1057_cov_46.006452_g2818_i0~~NODE_2952_length_1057_cov_46.006452_g2818_i0.p1  ORF type:complete len:325 (+),score=89.88 NODE_2952_length_1057_cov_46.006452_g2818_i0:65-976(+)
MPLVPYHVVGVSVGALPEDLHDYLTPTPCAKCHLDLYLHQCVVLEQLEFENRGTCAISLAVGSDFEGLTKVLKYPTNTMLRHKSELNRTAHYCVDIPPSGKHQCVRVTLEQPYEPLIRIGLANLQLRGTPTHASSLTVPEIDEVETPSGAPMTLQDVRNVLTNRQHAATQLSAPTQSTSNLPAPPPQPQSSSQPVTAPPSSLKKDRPLSGIHFVLSGFVHPDRTHLRDKGVGLGATFSQDWGPTSTHLVSAFGTTPKAKEVRQGGRGWIVTRDWLEDCASLNQRLSESGYTWDPDPLPKRPKV